MSKLTGNWDRVRKSLPCPICGHDSWCLILKDGTGAICRREKSNRPRPSGWFHWLVPENQRSHVKQSAPRPEREIRNVNWLLLLDAYHHGLNGHLAEHAESLHLTAASLAYLECGWDGEALTFPMHGTNWQVVGIRRRLDKPDPKRGQQRCVQGSHEGCFGPHQVPDGSLWLPEGPTDAAALTMLGLSAIGRPSCSGGVAILKRICAGRSVTIVGDNDKPDKNERIAGQSGALALGRALIPVCEIVRIIFPPDGIKDAREWVTRGATRKDFGA